jgi:hypothetical protein
VQSATWKLTLKVHHLDHGKEEDQATNPYSQVIDKVTLSLPCLSASFHPLSLFEWHTQSKEILLNLSVNAFNAQGSRVIISVVQVGTVRIYG